MKTKRKWYTVVLLYPDYVTDHYGTDIYVDWALGVSFDAAVAVVKQKAMRSNTDEDGECSINDADDFEVVGGVKGKRLWFEYGSWEE